MTYPVRKYRPGCLFYWLTMKSLVPTLVLAIVLFQAPGVSAQLKAPGATSNSVTVTWTAPGDDGAVGTAAQYDIRYSTSLIGDGNWNAATQATGVPTPQIAGSAETFAVTGLEPSTLYYFAIKAADEAPNWSLLSNVVSISTEAEAVAPAVVADLNVGSVTGTSATLDWTAPGDDGTVGTAAAYELRYAAAPITALNFSSATLVSGVPAPQVAGSSESFEVTGLSSSITYYFALKTADEVPNWSGISNVVSATTGSESIPPADIDDLLALVSTTTSISIGWTAPGDDGATGTASQYELRYAASPITALNFSSAALVAGVPVPLAAGSSETFTVTGLVENTTYYFAIKTADEVPNWSGLSNVLSAATSGDTTPPAAITDLGPSGGL